MRHGKRQRYILIGLTTATLALVAGGLLFLLSQSRRHDRTLMEFQALRAAASVTEYYARTGGIDESALPEDVLGFAVYDASGRARLRLGTAPEVLSDEQAAAAPASQLDRDRGAIRLLRPLGLPRTRNRGPMHHMPDRPHDRGMGPRAAPPAPPAPPAPATRLAGSEFLLIDYDVSGLLAATRTRFAYWSAAGLALFGLLAAVALMSGRIRRYEEESRRKEQLVRLGEAARTLAHEIKNPLGAIKLQTAMLRRQTGAGTSETRISGTGPGPGAAGNAGPDHGAAGNAGAAPGAGVAGDGAAQSRLDILDEEVARIDALVNEVREFLQEPAGTPEPVDLCDVIEGLPARFPFSVHTDLRCERPCRVRFDRNRLQSVLVNVVRNGAEAAGGTEEAGGTEAVSIRLERGQERVRVTVSDGGPGLPDDGDDERVFDPFYTRKHGGFGVGLSVSKRFVEAAGGSIVLRNRLDGPGAECIITLPAEE
jgi:signal transduction histidine kinase